MTKSFVREEKGKKANSCLMFVGMSKEKGKGVAVESLGSWDGKPV